MRPGSTAALMAMAALGLLLAACQASPGQPQGVDTPPPAASDSPCPGAGAGTPAPPSPASPPAPSPADQARLDQDLIAAAKASNAPLVAELIGWGGNVNAKDPIQDSAFLFAGAEGLNDVLQLTLAAGADVTSTNRYGGTALVPTSEHGHVETVKVLIAAGSLSTTSTTLAGPPCRRPSCSTTAGRASRRWCGCCWRPAQTPESVTRKAGRRCRTLSGSVIRR